MSLPPRFAPPTPIRLGDATGYHFDGDSVELHAEILGLPARSDAARWTLQLWADGVIQIAALPLGPLRPAASGPVRVSGRAPAWLPAGQAARSLSMILACRLPPAADQPQDRKLFATPAYFVQPRLEGKPGWRLQDGELVVELDGIHNPRDAGNLSGTLALELWSLQQPYAGGDWSGTPLASLELGQLGGQQRWSPQRHALRVQELPAGGCLTLMLREWSAGGYVTRDWRQLAGARAAPDGRVSVNRATTAVLRSVRGISDKMARTLVASRPFASLDELRWVRGMTPRLFERLRDRIEL